MTAQAGDNLCYHGERHTLFSTPLEQHFKTAGRRPAFGMRSTACWRGYVASWEFLEDVLFLTEIEARIDEHAVTVADLFPGSGGRVRADWVKRVLRVPQGDCMQYVHGGYASTYERDLFLSTWEGRLVLVEVVDNRTGKRTEPTVTGQLEHVFEPVEAAFIRAVRAAPRDRTTRLVYADWLDERNDPRGEFIRLEDEREAAQDLAAAEARIRRREVVQKQVKHWLWMKLLDYPLPKNDSESDLFDE